MKLKGDEVMNRIKELRTEKGLSIEQLSDELKKSGVSISPSSISKYERGARQPKIENWLGMANFFGVSIDYLQGLSDVKNIFDHYHDRFSIDRTYIEKDLYNHFGVSNEQEFKNLLLKEYNESKYKEILEYFEISNILLSDKNNASSKYLKKLENSIKNTNELINFVYFIEQILDMFLRASSGNDHDSMMFYNKLKKLVHEYIKADHSQID